MKLTSLIFLFLPIFFISCSPKIKHFENLLSHECNKILIGKWQSDRERTINWLYENRKFTKERIEKLDSVIKFGTMIVEIDEFSTKCTYAGETTEEPNKIIGCTCNTIASIEKNPLSNQDEIRIIKIESAESYSVYNDWADIREYFKKIE